MKNDFAEDYSVENWWKSVRQSILRMEPLPEDKKPKWKSIFYLGISWVILGFVFVSTYWDGLSEWWEIVNMSYSEVKETPYLPIWTSGRGMQGIFYIIIGYSFISRGLENKKKNKSEPAD